MDTIISDFQTLSMTMITVNHIDMITRCRFCFHGFSFQICNRTSLGNMPLGKISGNTGVCCIMTVIDCTDQTTLMNADAIAKGHVVHIICDKPAILCMHSDKGQIPFTEYIVFVMTQRNGTIRILYHNGCT